MKKKKGTGDELRRAAEERLRSRSGSVALPPEDAARLVHELEVHRIELEIQNDELTRARIDLERSLARYTSLFDAAPVGYVTFTHDGTIQQANVPASTLLGLGCEALVGHRLAAFVVDEHKRTLADLLARVNDGEEKVSGIVAVAPHGTTQTKEVELVVARVADAPERHAVLVDVTDRRVVEEQLRSAQKMDAIGRLAGGVAHDFNNLLTVILGHAELALGTLPEGKLREDMFEVKDAAERAAELTHRLLAFSRRQTFRPRVVDVNELLGGLSQIVQRLLGDSIEVKTELGDDVARVEIDPGQLERVVMNLAMNARDAMARGGTLTLATANARDGSDHVLLTVRDTGVGMDAATMAKIFEPFFTTKKHGEGTGFGLATVYGIVKQCGGDISAWSEVGIGTSFEIRLPSTRAERSPSTRRTTTMQATGTETLLVVEDERGLLALVERALCNGGYKVLTAGSGEEALEVSAAYEGTIDLLLSDVILPQASGPVTAAALTQRRPALKVLYMSGYTRNELGEDGILDRDTHLIEKPFTADALRRKVRAVLDGTAAVATDT